MCRFVAPNTAGAAVLSWLTLFCMDSYTQEPKPLHEHHPWHGLKVGTWLEWKVTETEGGETKKTQSKEVLEVDKYGTKVKTYPMKDGKYDFSVDRTIVPRLGFNVLTDERAKLLETRKGKHKIDGKEHDCEIRKYRLQPDHKAPTANVEVLLVREMKIPARGLRVDEGPSVFLPSNVVGIDYEVKNKDITESYKMRVTSLKATRKVGAKNIDCVLEEGEVLITAADGTGKGKLQRWLSDTVPGRVVCELTEGEKGEKGKMVKFKAVEEVISFGHPAKE